MLVRTHPDKVGNSKYFLQVHEAFSAIESAHRERKKYKMAPNHKTSYDQNIAINELGIPEPTKMKRFSNKKFNKIFEKNRIDLQDPYRTSGYQHKMADSLTYQEDIEMLKRYKLHIPNQEVVLHKEPEFLQSGSYVENCYEYGKTEVNDFSGGGGTDIMKAFCNPCKNIDTSQRYRNLDEIHSSRFSQNLDISREDQDYIRHLEIERERIESIRLNAVRRNDNTITQKYSQMHRRLI